MLLLEKLHLETFVVHEFARETIWFLAVVENRARDLLFTILADVWQLREVTKTRIIGIYILGRPDYLHLEVILVGHQDQGALGPMESAMDNLRTVVDKLFLNVLQHLHSKIEYVVILRIFKLFAIFKLLRQ